MDLQTFSSDRQGRTYTDVMNDPRFDFAQQLEFFNSAERQHRMFIAQEHFKTPPLGGVLLELEKHPAFACLHKYPKSETHRLRQAIGVMVKIIMEANGWTKAGKQGSLYSLSKIFGHTELYNPAK